MNVSYFVLFLLIACYNLHVAMSEHCKIIYFESRKDWNRCIVLCCVVKNIWCEINLFVSIEYIYIIIVYTQEYYFLKYACTHLMGMEFNKTKGKTDVGTKVELTKSFRIIWPLTIIIVSSARGLNHGHLPIDKAVLAKGGLSVFDIKFLICGHSNYRTVRR
jgi:hypothetical protein